MRGSPFLTLALDRSGLCSVGAKCVKKDQHEGPCWPTDPKEEADAES